MVSFSKKKRLILTARFLSITSGSCETIPRSHSHGTRRILYKPFLYTLHWQKKCAVQLNVVHAFFACILSRIGGTIEVGGTTDNGKLRSAERKPLYSPLNRTIFVYASLGEKVNQLKISSHLFFAYYQLRK